MLQQRFLFFQTRGLIKTDGLHTKGEQYWDTEAAEPEGSFLLAQEALDKTFPFGRGRPVSLSGNNGIRQTP